QDVVKTLPNPLLAPVPKDVVYRFPFRKVVRQLPPLTAGTHNIQDRIEDDPPIDRPATDLRAPRQQTSNHFPSPVRQIAGILRMHRYGSVFLDLRTQEAES